MKEDAAVRAEESKSASAPVAEDAGKTPGREEMRAAAHGSMNGGANRAKKKRKLFSASGIAKLAMLSALAFAVTFLEFPIFPAASFLQLDFANVFVLIGGFMYGPLAAVIISGVKECLCLLKTSTGGVGEIANFIITFCFVIVPTLVYRYRKGLLTVSLTLAAGVVLQIAAGLISNRYINFPLFMGEGAAAAFASLWWYVVLFNLIKGAAVSLVTVLLYKRISWLLDKF